ncbi:MAG: DUF3574 domain-containing protein [Bryobacteraceae bacterium]|nr:DUF3574 domain-containing protein [Bryobacteraceae bacterium]
MKRLFRALGGALLLLTLSAPAAFNSEMIRRPRTQEVWSKTELYFGTQKPDGTAVSDQEFLQFVDQVVTPRFPAGLTLLTGFGQFLNSQSVLIKERSHLLILFNPPLSAETNKKIDEIREEYKKRFQQESVLRADSLSSISF